MSDLLYEFIRVEGAVKIMKLLRGSGASYKSFGICVLSNGSRWCIHELQRENCYYVLQGQSVNKSFYLA
jgi:hypothetical protein